MWKLLGEHLLDFSALEEEYQAERSVFRDKRVLSLSYVPSTLVCREKEEKSLAKILVQGVNEGYLPPMIRVFGSTGTGKTLVVRSVLEKFSKYKGNVFRFFYVNLKNCRTVFSVANAILSAVCGRKVPVNLGVDRVFSEIWSEVASLRKDGGELFLCLVLDEVDSIFGDKHFEPSDFFYRILRAGNSIPELRGVKICLITITNNLGMLEDNLDARVKSSMGSDVIHFPIYSIDELKQILEARVNEAFKPKKITGRVIGYCAELVFDRGGDARKAIDLLRVSGEMANENSEIVSQYIVHTANQKVEKDWIRDMVKSLSYKSGEVILVVALYTRSINKKATTREIYNYYLKLKTKNQNPNIIGERRFLDFINELETYGFLTTRNISRGRGGYKKEITLNLGPQTVIDCLIPKNTAGPDYSPWYK